MALQQIGVLTLAKTDDTPSFHALRRGLRRNGYVEGQDYSLHFGFAPDDTQLGSLAEQLLRIPNIKVIVTGGNKALAEVKSRCVGALKTVNIVQAVGGNPVPDDPYMTGFNINCEQTCYDQVDHLINRFGVKGVSILVDDHTTNPVYDKLNAYASHRITVHPPIDAPTPAALTSKKFDSVADSFMLIPNGMFFDNCKTITGFVDGKQIPKIYPEREYFNTSTNQTNVLVHGHKIPQTYNRAADHVYNFLEGRTKQPPSEAPDLDIDTP
jgi:hypothetical protein